MQVREFYLIVSIVVIAVAGWSALSRSNPWVIVLAAVVFVIFALGTYNSPEWEYYLLVGGEPLAITVGIADLTAGIILQLALIGILFGQDIVLMKAPALASLLLIAGATVVFAVFAMSMYQVLIPFLVLLVVLAVTVFLLGIRNRLEKMQYSREGI